MDSSPRSQYDPSPGKRQKLDDGQAVEGPSVVERASSLLRNAAISDEMGEVSGVFQDMFSYIEKAEKRGKTVQASSMSLYDVEKAFGLSTETQNVMWKHPPVAVPPWALESMEHTTEVTLDWSRTNEAYARLMINQVLVAAIYLQSRRQELAEPQSSSEKPPAALGLVLEVALEQPAHLKGKDVVVEGVADYAIFHDDAAQDKCAASLIALEAKKRFHASVAIPQLAAYMGIIHSQRKQAGKQNCVVWGFSSDGVEYRFCRIDNDGFLTLARPLEFVGPEQEIVFGIICGIVKAAALSSPYTSLEKDPEVREKVIAAMGTRDPQRMLKFDYGISETNYGLNLIPSPALTHTQPVSETKDEVEGIVGGVKADGNIENQ